MKKPKENKVLLYNDKEKSWVWGNVESLLSIQFTANFLDSNGIKYFNYYFYSDHNITWKDSEK